MVRFFFDLSTAEPEDLISLDFKLSHHLRDVLRLSPGCQLIAVCEKTRQEYLSIIAESEPSQSVKIKLLSRLESRKNVDSVVSSLICALPKGAHADQICEQVSQLGVEKILFWQADRSVVKSHQVQLKIERWRKIAEASARQSQGVSIPEVLYLPSTGELCRLLTTDLLKGPDLLAICSLSSDAKIISELAVPSAKVHMLVGPEGDFSQNEIEAFREIGGQSISLGKQVLRVETAALVAVAMAQALWGLAKQQN